MMSLASIPVSASALWTRIIAILMMSAALPWIGLFMATRSPNARRFRFFDESSGIYRRLPYIVVV